MMIRHKKGEESSTAAGLVVVITGLIILYILFLPQEARDDLLGKSPGTGGGAIKKPALNIDSNKTVFTASPGRIDYTARDEFEYNLQAFTLYAKTGAKEIEKINDFFVRNGWFDKKTQSATFEIDDMQNTEKVMLSFTAKTRKGTLLIKLNGEPIYENRVATANPEPIAIRKSELKRSNTLEFSTGGVGVKFWATNEYSLEQVKIIGEVTDVSRQQSKNTFFVSEEESKNIEKATLRFVPDCTPKQAGVLSVELNDREIFSGIPDCGSINSYMVSASAINPGKNSVTFTTEQGSYLVDRIQVRTELKEPANPTYYFELDEELFASEKETDARCGDIDGVCPDNCGEDTDKDCCMEKYVEPFWCDSRPSNLDDRCVGHVDASQCSRCASGYEDEDGDAPTACERQCGDDNDGVCPSGCNPDYDKDCCFSATGNQYWCDDMPITGINYACVDEVSSTQCSVCPTGYDGEARDPSCPRQEKGEEEKKLKNKYDITLKFSFTDDATDKEADIYVNGRRTSFRTRQNKFERKIDEYAAAGTNSIKIVPKTTLDIREIRVELD